MEMNENLSNYNKNNICRICMKNDLNLFPMCKEVCYGGSMITMAEIITECSKYPVTPNDQLPAQICDSCMSAARSALQFKRQTEEAYRQLKALYDITWISKNDEVSFNCNTSSRTRTQTIDKHTQTEIRSMFQCEVCPKKFFVESELRNHRAALHLTDSKKCRVCGKTFTHLGQLKIHLSTEHPNEGVRCFKCTVCSRLFSRKDHLKRHLMQVHKIADNKLNISKVSLDEVEMENLTLPPVNNYNSHWPDYLEDHGNKHDANNENMAATNPFSSEDEGLEHHFNDMNEEDVKQFVETISQPEISIKVEKTDYTYSTSDDKYEKHNNIGHSSFEPLKFYVSSLKPEKSEDDIEINDEMEDDEVDNLNSSFYENHSTSDDETDDHNGHESETNEKNFNMSSFIKEENATEYPTSSNTSIEKKIKPPRRRHGSSKNEVNICKECNRTFTRYNHLLRHMLTHSDEKPHVCNFCGRGFSRSDHLQKHIQSIHCEKIYKCDQCSSAYGRKDHLQRHIDTRHNKDPTVQRPQFDCDMCEKKFTTKSYLAKHKLLHTDRLYACKHCSETFPERELMKEHQKKEHAQPRNFLCNICGDSFQRNEYLKIHMRRHTGEKPYKCRFCEKGFPRSTDLKMHERYHIGHKPNICTLCGKGFHRPYNLTIHMRTHTGEKPYKCNQCPQAFAQSNDLKAHIRRHTGERFRCDLCSAAFLQRYGLNAHLRTVHGIIVTSFTGRLRKTDQSVDGVEELEPLASTDFTAHQNPQEQSQSSLPTPTLDSNVSIPSPLYLGHHFINSIPSVIAASDAAINPTTPSSPIDISSTSATLPLALAHLSTQQI